MMIICHYIPRTCCYGAIYEFVVVGVGRYQVEMVIWGNEFYVDAVDNGIHYIDNHAVIGKTKQNLFILFQYLVSNTQRVFPRLNRVPYPAVRTAWGNALNEAVGIKNYAHGELIQLLLLCFLFPEPCVKIHVVNLVKAFLVKSAVIPKAVEPGVHLLRIVFVEHLFQFYKVFFVPVELKHLEQVYLRRGECCCNHNPNMFWGFGGKITEKYRKYKRYNRKNI